MIADQYPSGGTGRIGQRDAPLSAAEEKAAKARAKARYQRAVAHMIDAEKSAILRGNLLKKPVKPWHRWMIRIGFFFLKAGGQVDGKGNTMPCGHKLIQSDATTETACEDELAWFRQAHERGMRQAEGRAVRKAVKDE